MSFNVDLEPEWLEADGLGGFASGTVSGIRTRRYQALLLTARHPPTDRLVLVNGFEALAITANGRFALSSQAYGAGTIFPDGARRVAKFSAEPWPTWEFRLEDGTVLRQELCAIHRRSTVVLRFALVANPADLPVHLELRPLLSGRDYHALQHENSAFRFDAAVSGEAVTLQPYPDIPAVTFLSNGGFAPAPDWYRAFRYQREAERGLEASEDLAMPGVFSFTLQADPAVLVLSSGPAPVVPPPAKRRGAKRQPAAAASPTASDIAAALVAGERTRRAQLGPLRAADAYLVQRGAGSTLIAGYPWFTDWGRDTFISLRGLCLASGRTAEAGEILLAWAEAVSEGMLPNRFPDAGAPPEYNSVDASLWFIVAVHDLLSPTGRTLAPKGRTRLLEACEAILSGYAAGTRYGIRLAEDGLLAAGEAGVQLTWMDAKVGDWVVTPRIGKPVEVQALWLNALEIGGRLRLPSAGRWRELRRRGQEAFEATFWNAQGGCLFDVVDVNHQPGHADASFRPNQIFAVGGLPFAVLEGERARQVVDAVEQKLLTPVGLRTLAPGEAGYAARYEGDLRARDGAYHQGTVWPWLLGPFTEAWVRVRGGTAAAKAQARRQFLGPLRALAENAGGHLFEIADGDPPHLPRGCPFQAWSLGELLRLETLLSAAPAAPKANARKRPAAGRRTARSK